MLIRVDWEARPLYRAYGLYRCTQDRGADPDIQHSVRYGNLFKKNPVFFPVEKSVIFLRRKINYFSVWKNKVFLLAVLYWTVDGTTGQLGTLDSGQLGTLDSGQWTVDRRTVQYGTMGHWTGHPVLDRIGSGQWTVDSGQWTVDSGRDRVDRTTVLTLEY